VGRWIKIALDFIVAVFKNAEEDSVEHDPAKSGL